MNFSYTCFSTFNDTTHIFLIILELTVEVEFLGLYWRQLRLCVLTWCCSRDRKRFSIGTADSNYLFIFKEFFQFGSWIKSVLSFCYRIIKDMWALWSFAGHAGVVNKLYYYFLRASNMKGLLNINDYLGIHVDILDYKYGFLVAEFLCKYYVFLDKPCFIVQGEYKCYLHISRYIFGALSC